MSQHRFHALRGAAYVRAYKQFLADEGSAIAAAFDAIVERDGKFTLKGLGELCNQFRCPVTLMDDALPSLTGLRYPSGTWERAGVKAKDIGVIWEGDRND